MLLRTIVEHVNLPALGKAAGLDLPSLLEKIPASLLKGVLGGIPIDLGSVLLGSVGPVLTPVLLSALTALGITDAGGNTTLINLLGLLGLDLSDPLNLSNLDLPGIKLITTGPPFTLLKLLGLDLGWVPGLPNSVANAINSTTYLDIGLKGLLNTLIDRLNGNVNLPVGGLLGNPLGLPISLPINLPVGELLSALQKIADDLPVDVDAAKIRVPIVVGFGLGAFAAGSAYQQVVDQLPYQPGGAKSPTNGTDPVLGSFAILPMVLLRNPGRANGGLFARAFPLAGLFGIDTVTPDTEVSSSGGIPILNTGLSLGGANLIPVKIDATVEYDIMSDFAAWPNPLSMANSLIGAVLPTYLLWGIDTSNLTPQLLTQIQAALGRTTNLNDPPALNLYLTLPTNSLPLLEPLYLATDVTNLLTLGAFPTPLGMLANALAPAMTSLVNLGYTDVVRNPDGTYTRTLDQAGVPTPFLSFPDINWGLVPGDIINLVGQRIPEGVLQRQPDPGSAERNHGTAQAVDRRPRPVGWPRGHPEWSAWPCSATGFAAGSGGAAVGRPEDGDPVDQSTGRRADRQAGAARGHTGSVGYRRRSAGSRQRNRHDDDNVNRHDDDKQEHVNIDWVDHLDRDAAPGRPVRVAQAAKQSGGQRGRRRHQHCRRRRWWSYRWPDRRLGRPHAETEHRHQQRRALVEQRRPSRQLNSDGRAVN